MITSKNKPIKIVLKVLRDCNLIKRASIFNMWRSQEY